MTYEALNADQRGGTAPSGKHSLTVADAATQLLRDGYTWGGDTGQPLTITYAFRSTAPTKMPEDTSGFQRFDAAQIHGAEQALQAWAKVANITFVRVGSGDAGEGAYSNDATILFGGYRSGESGASAFAYLPGNPASSSLTGDVWVNQTYSPNHDLTQGSEGFLTLLHEIGHTLGLSHPSDYDVTDSDVDVTYATGASYNEDSIEYTVMSYFELTDTGGYARAGREPSTPLIDDIAAVQRLYGANMTANPGDTSYGSVGSPYGPGSSLDQSISNSNLYATIWDSGGNDTINVGDDTSDDHIDLRAGAFSDVNGNVGALSIALGVTIENAISGSGNDTIVGNQVANYLIGGNGDDQLSGGPGDDILDGGNGTDSVVITAALAGAGFTLNAADDLFITTADGRDHLLRVETVIFTDRTIVTSTVVDVNQLYLTYMGRAAASSELSYWVGNYAAGHPLADERAAILNDASGRAHTAALLDGYYQAFMGRDPSGAELSYWDGQIRAGAEFAGVRQVIAADRSSQLHLSDVVAQGYGEYLGRTPTAAETSYWVQQLSTTGSVPQFDAALANTDGARLLDLITDAYQFGLGRPPTRNEQNYWSTQLSAGTSPHDIRVTIANDTPTAGLSNAAVRMVYHDYMGRDPTGAELSYWNGQARAGVSLATVRTIVFDDPDGQAHSPGVIASDYQAVFGRAPSAGETAIWMNLIQQGATPATLEATLLLDGSARGVFRASAAASYSTTALPASFTHAVIDQFSYENDDPYEHAGVYYRDIDKIDLRGTPFAGANPLAFARDVTELNGTHDVLITFDAQHDILLRNITLSQLHAEQFILA